jgi:hypothetical protein
MHPSPAWGQYPPPLEPFLPHHATGVSEALPTVEGNQPVPGVTFRGNDQLECAAAVLVAPATCGGYQGRGHPLAAYLRQHIKVLQFGTQAVFDAMGAKKQIDYIEMPEAIRDQYQYFTEAKIEKLRSAGCPVTFRSLEDAVYDYVVNHLKTKDPYL